jgi:hypothetical protein
VQDDIVMRLDQIGRLMHQLDAVRHERDDALEPDADRHDRVSREIEIARLRFERWGEEITLSDDEVILLGQLGESRALLGDSLRAMSDPDGNGVIDPQALSTLLRYAQDLGRQEEDAVLRAYDADGDGRFSSDERDRALAGIRADLALFERLRGVDLDLDGTVSAHEVERFLRAYERGDPSADLDADGRVGQTDLVRLSQGLSG